MANLGGWLQIIMGLFGLAQQAYQLVTGAPLDLTHTGIATGLVAGGAATVAHLSKPSDTAHPPSEGK